VVHRPQKEMAIPRGPDIREEMIKPPLPDFIEAHGRIGKPRVFASNIRGHLFEVPGRVNHYYVEAPLGNDQAPRAYGADFVFVVFLLT